MYCLQKGEICKVAPAEMGVLACSPHPSVWHPALKAHRPYLLSESVLRVRSKWHDVGGPSEVLSKARTDLCSEGPSRQLAQKTDCLCSVFLNTSRDRLLMSSRGRSLFLDNFESQPTFSARMHLLPV